jgi:hypothetical protein
MSEFWLKTVFYLFVGNYKTKYQNKNIYRTAIQKVANLYEKGLFVNKYEASSLLRNALKKMDTYELVNNEVIIINPE